MANKELEQRWKEVSLAPSRANIAKGLIQLIIAMSPNDLEMAREIAEILEQLSDAELSQITYGLSNIGDPQTAREVTKKLKQLLY